MNDETWITVFSTGELHRASIVQALLQEHGIESVQYNQLDSTNITLGAISIMVHPEQAADAWLLIESEIS